MAEEPKQRDKDAPESEVNKRWGEIKRFFLDNPTLALTLLYLYVTAIGMLYSGVLYGRFGINIFDYSEIADFTFDEGSQQSTPGTTVLQVSTDGTTWYDLTQPTTTV